MFFCFRSKPCLPTIKISYLIMKIVFEEMQTAIKLSQFLLKYLLMLEGFLKNVSLSKS